MSLQTWMKDRLECPVCMELFEEPKQLSCGHNCCGKCIQKIMLFTKVRQISCPQCKIVTTIPFNGQLPTAYTLKALVERLKIDSTKESPCSKCSHKTSTDQMFACKTCQNSGKLEEAKKLCSLCTVKHHNCHTTVCCADLASPAQMSEAVTGITEHITDFETTLKKVSEGFEHSQTYQKEFQQAASEAVLYKIKSFVDSINRPFCTKTSLDEIVAGAKTAQNAANEFFHRVICVQKQYVSDLKALLTTVQTVPSSLQPDTELKSAGCALAKANELSDEFTFKSFVSFANVQELVLAQKTFALEHATKKIIGKKVITNHRSKQANHIFKVDHITEASANKVFFWIVSNGVRQKTSVADYFGLKYFPLSNPFLPCAVEKAPCLKDPDQLNYYPLETINVWVKDTEVFNVPSLPQVLDKSPLNIRCKETPGTSKFY